MSVHFSHSVAQALQASSHVLQRASKFALVLLAEIKLLQASAQAMQSFSHCSIPDVPLHSEAQAVHSSTQTWQASMQFLIF
jgi:hypothetical protein